MNDVKIMRWRNAAITTEVNGRIEGNEFIFIGEKPPTSDQLLKMYGEFTDYVPDEQLRKKYCENACLFLPIDKRNLYNGLIFCLHIESLHIMGTFAPVKVWAKTIGQYTFSREFLETLLDNLGEAEQTEGALLVIKKLAEMGEENKRFEL